MTPQKGPQAPEREGAPVVEDPAVMAGKEAEAAKAAWFAISVSTVADEKTPEYKAAEKRSKKADDAFAAAPVTSLAGVLVKLRALGKDIAEDSGADVWELGHVKTITAFLEGFAGEAQTEPLIALWAEQNRLVAECRATDTDLEIDARGDKLSAIEEQIANTEAKTLAGVVVQIKLRESVLGHDHWVFSADLTRNVVTALERMGGGVATEPDPAVVAFEELKAAWAAFDALDCDATYKRYAEARDAVNHAVPVSLAGVHAKVRALLEPYRTDPDAGGFDQDHDISAKAMLPFLEGTPSPAPKPDPVCVLFTKWGTLQDEAIALEKADPDSDDPAVEDQREKLGLQQNDIEDQIIETAATSVGGIAVKLRFMAYAQYPLKGLVDLYATPAKDTDFKGFIEAYREDTGLSMDDNLLLGALCDAEQLAGVTKPEPDPVVTLFTEWGAINEEVIAHLAAIPEGAGKNMGKTGHVPGKPGVAPEEKDWDDALDRRDAVEQKILETPATSMRGVAGKIRLITHATAAESANLANLAATPAREIDYEKECIVVEYDTQVAISALLDAERLAGVS